MQRYQLKGTVIQIKKKKNNKWSLKCLKFIPKFHISTIYNSGICALVKFVIFLKCGLLINTFYCLFCLYTNYLRLSNLKLKKMWTRNIQGLLFPLFTCSYKSYFLDLPNLGKLTFKKITDKSLSKTSVETRS